MRDHFERLLLVCIVLAFSPSLATRPCCAWTEAATTPAGATRQEEQGRPKPDDGTSTPTDSAPRRADPDRGDPHAAADVRFEGKNVYRIQLADPVSPSTPARLYNVSLLKDRNGFPVEYALSLVTNVCADDQCKAVEVTLVWNAPGYFERLTCQPGTPLTKKDHAPFAAEDYTKLHRILKDQHSILGSWTLAYLQRPVETFDGVDAVSSPTPITVQESVIQDAAYTTWALWHWANGEIVPKLRRITEQNCTPAYLNHLLASEERRYADFALDYLLEDRSSDPRFVESVFHILENGERDQVTRSLEFLTLAIPDKRKLYDRLIESCIRMRAADCPLVLQHFAAEPDIPVTMFESLTGRLEQLPYYPIHLILRMLEERQIASEKTISNVAALLDGEDFFVARRAYKHLLKQQLDPLTENKVHVFRERYGDRL